MVDYFLSLFCLVLTCLVKLPSAIYPYYKFTTIVNALPLLHATIYNIILLTGNFSFPLD